MADLLFAAKGNSYTLTQGSAGITVLQVNAPTNQRVKVLRLELSFDAVATSDKPALVEILRVTTAGTATSLAPVKLDSAIGTSIQSTCSEAATVEPAASDVIFKQWVRVNGGPFVYQFAGDSRIVIPAAGRIAVRVTPPATLTATTTVLTTLVCEE